MTMSEQIQGYKLIFEKSSNGYACYSPDIPGCIAAADTLAETEKLMHEAIEFHFKGLRADGDPIPQPSTIITEYTPLATPA